MTKEKPSTPATSAHGEYTFHRDRDGCDDVFLIEDDEGNCILKLHFWAEPDTAEAEVAEAKAEMLVAALNLKGGGWVQQPYSIRPTLAARKQIATIWSVEDVQMVRPGLTDKQAWEVLQRVEYDDDRSYGITRDTLRITAGWLFPKFPAT
jgi:hypothetical protein